MGKDFSGQDLRGKSFKGQDLRGADFSDAKLGGVDFSGADLSGAKFCRAQMGKSGKGLIVVAGVMQLFVGVVAGFLNLFGMVLLVLLFEAALKGAGLSVTAHILEITAIFALLSSFVIWLAVQRQRFDYLAWLFLTIVACALPLVGADAATSAFWNMIASAIGHSLGATICAAVAGGGALAVAGGVAPAVAGGVALMGALAISRASKITGTGGVALAVAAIIFIRLGVILGRRAIQKEEPQLSLLRRLQLTIRCINATNFTAANLSATNFSGANLQHARFTGAKLQGCIWQDAQNLHLAQTRNTLPAPRQVRVLLTTGNSPHQ